MTPKRLIEHGFNPISNKSQYYFDVDEAIVSSLDQGYLSDFRQIWVTDIPNLERYWKTWKDWNFYLMQDMDKLMISFTAFQGVGTTKGGKGMTLKIIHLDWPDWSAMTMLQGINVTVKGFAR